MYIERDSNVCSPFYLLIKVPREFLTSLVIKKVLTPTAFKSTLLSLEGSAYYVLVKSRMTKVCFFIVLD